MKYTVDWLPDPLATLTAIWLQSADRQAVTQAQATIDRLLTADPIRNGKPLAEGLIPWKSIHCASFMRLTLRRESSLLSP